MVPTFESSLSLILKFLNVAPAQVVEPMMYCQIPSETSKSLGVPERQWYCDQSHVVALLGCIICFVVSILAIHLRSGPCGACLGLWG